MNKTRNTCVGGGAWLVALATIFVCLSGGSTFEALAAVVFTETWDSSDEGWSGSTGDAVVQHDAGGNPGGSMSASFADSLFPLTDGFYANSGASSGSFVGDYTGITDFAGWRFHLNPLDYLPSSIYLRLNGGGNTYLYNVSSQISTIGAWNSVTVSASSGWIGPGGMGGFAAALGNVSWIELSFTMGGNDAQNYYLDNFETYITSGGGGGPSAAVPEPNVLLSYVLGCAILMVGRRHYKGLSPKVARAGHS